MQGGNLAFAKKGEHCRASIGGEFYSWFFRCRNLSLHKHRKTAALEIEAGERVKQKFPFRECRNLLLLLQVISAAGGAQIFPV